MTAIGRLLMLGTALAGVPALAQSTDAPPGGGAAAGTTGPIAPAAETGGISDIVVTAQKRAENIQDVPISISAFTASALRERAVQSVAQLSAITPNVNLDAGTPFSASTAVLSAYIRGIGSDDFAFNIDPGVGIYLDGVYLARTVGANQDLLDVERIEILKGPQGTLFGRNSIGGAISIVTRDPGDRFGITGDLTTGRYNLFQGRASADVPITDDLKSSITFSVKRQDGYLKRIPFPDQRANNSPPSTAFSAAGYDTASDEGAANNASVRGKLKWDNGGHVTGTLSADYTSDHSTSANKVLGIFPDIPGNFAGSSHLPGTAFDPTGTTGFNFAGLYNFCIGSTATQIAARNAQALCGVGGTQFNPRFKTASIASVNVDANPANDRLPWDNRFLIANPDRSYATGNSYSNLQSWGVSGTLNFDIAHNVRLKSITAYREIHWNAGLDGDGSPLNFAQLSFTLNQYQVSQEFQLIGDLLDKKLNYVAGAYFFKEAGNLHDYVTFGEGQVQVDGPNRLETSNYAFFGQVDYRPIDLLGVTVGGRYTHEKKTFEGGQQELNGFDYKLFGCSDANGNVTPGGAFPLAPITCQQGLEYPDPNNPVRVYVPGVNTKRFNNFSPKVGVQLHPADRILVYGSWSKGYKTGGWTTRLTNPQGDVAPDFNEEKATTYEVGAKTTFLDRRLQLNAAAFTTDYKDIQLNIQIGTSPTIANAGNARIRGFELEVVAEPVDGLSLTGAVGYVDATYTSVSAAAAAVGGANGFQAGTLVGGDLPKTPHWKFNISPRYKADLGTRGSLVFLADYTRTSSAWNDTQRTYLLRRSGADQINANVTYAPASAAWSLTGGGTNLTDKRYITSGSSNLADGIVFGTYNRPREWYLRVGFKF